MKHRRLVAGVLGSLALFLEAPETVSGATGTAPPVAPEAPAALAVGPSGALYLVDRQREQILRYSQGKGFAVVAGNGIGGISPDGTPALRAHLSLSWYTGLVVSRHGTAYFTEGSRVREIEPHGVLGTVAGGGTIALKRTPVPAREAALDGPAGLTFGPGGELYIGTSNGVYRLGPEGRLYWVVGEPYPESRLPPHWGGVFSNPAVQNDFTYAVHLAFDSRGDLFVAGGGGLYGLYEKTSSGALRFVENLRGQGGLTGSLASAPDGTVVSASNRGLQRLRPDRVPGTVQARWPSSCGPHHVPFSPLFGVGVAIGPAGQVYVDTDAGDAVPDQGLLEVLPDGRVAWLWAQTGGCPT